MLNLNKHIKISKENWEFLDTNCLNIKSNLTQSDITEISKLDFINVIQPYYFLPDIDSWLLLNNQIFKNNPNVSLCIWGDKFSNSFEFIQYLDEVKHLELNQVKFKNKETIYGLKSLKSLKINSGNISDLNFINSFIDLEVLELTLVRNLVSIDFVSNLKNLKQLTLNGLSNIEELHFDSELLNLTKIYLINLKKMSKINSIEKITNLELLNCYNLSKDLEATEFIFLKNLKKLKEINISLSNSSKQKVMDALKQEVINSNIDFQK